MTGEKFAEIVNRRANDRVQNKLRKFKAKIKDAFVELTGSASLYDTGKPDDERDDTANRAILKRCLEAKDFNFNSGWPSMIWRREEEAVTKELLGMMDEMQKALLSSGPKEGDCKPN